MSAWRSVCDIRLRSPEGTRNRLRSVRSFHSRLESRSPESQTVPRSTYGMRNVDVPFALQNMVDGHLQNAVPGPVPEQDVSVHFHFFLFREEPQFGKWKASADLRF